MQQFAKKGLQELSFLKRKLPRAILGLSRGFGADEKNDPIGDPPFFCCCSFFLATALAFTHRDPLSRSPSLTRSSPRCVLKREGAHRRKGASQRLATRAHRTPAGRESSIAGGKVGGNRGAVGGGRAGGGQAGGGRAGGGCAGDGRADGVGAGAKKARFEGTKGKATPVPPARTARRLA